MKPVNNKAKLIYPNVIEKPNKQKEEKKKKDLSFIEEARMTPFERVIKFLRYMKTLLLTFKVDKNILLELEWVTKTIQMKDLYSFNVSSNKIENISKENSELVMGILNSFSNNVNSEMNKLAILNQRRPSEIKKDSLKNSNIIKSLESDILNRSSTFREKENTKKIEYDNELKKANSYKIAETKLDTDALFEIFEHDVDDIDLDILIDTTDFNIFKTSEKLGRKRVLPFLYCEIIKRMDIIDSYSIDILKINNFTQQIRDGYKISVLYHNDLHAIDLCQTLYTWSIKSGLSEILKLKKLDLLSLYTGAIVHDYKHPGFTNAFQMNNLTDIALTYNDKSVLENMHISESFKILLREECNFLENISVNEFKEMRKRMIECVLATDMSHHSRIISLVKAKSQILDINKGKNVDRIIDLESKTLFDDQQEMLNLLIHLGDISHNTKTFEISKTWTDLLYEEFYQQGDTERNLGISISMFCDRNNSNIPMSQIGFIKGIVIPSFDVLINIYPNLSYILKNLEENIKCWEKILGTNK